MLRQVTITALLPMHCRLFRNLRMGHNQTKLFVMGNLSGNEAQLGIGCVCGIFIEPVRSYEF